MQAVIFLQKENFAAYSDDPECLRSEGSRTQSEITQHKKAVSNSLKWGIISLDSHELLTTERLKMKGLSYQDCYRGVSCIRREDFK